MNRKILLDLIGILLILLVVVVGYKLSPLLLPKSDLTVEPDAACNLQEGACSASLPGGGQVTLTIGTRPIPLVKAFPVTVEAGGASRVEIDFAGLDMDMGFNRPLLQERAPGVFVGEATLPVCVTGRMSWQATVLVDLPGSRVAIPFRFVTG